MLRRMASSLEKVQIRFTKFVTNKAHMSYTERLKDLKLPTLKYQRILGDMIELFKSLTNKYDNVCMPGLKSYLDSR